MALYPGICTALTTQLLDTLKTGGISTFSDFITVDPEKLARDFKLAYKDICSIRRVLLAETSAFPISGAALYQDVLTTQSILSSGIESFDNLLDGGLHTGELTEVAGDTACGKTKLCMHTLAKTISTGTQTAFYIDSGGSFDVHGLLEMLVPGDGEQIEGDGVKSLFERIKVVQALDVYQLFAALHSLRDNLALSKQGGMQMEKELADFFQNLKLVVIDNLASIINPIMGGDFAYSQGTISHAGLKLKEIASSFSVAVMVTNNMVSSFQSTEHRKAALGRAWSHVPHSRVLVSRLDDKRLTREGTRKAQLVKSGRQMTPSICHFSLAATGRDSPG